MTKVIDLNDDNTVYRIKITGETVQVIDLLEDEELLVIRAKVTRDGLVYERMSMPIDAIESVDDSIQREYKEAVYRHKLMEQGLTEPSAQTKPAADFTEVPN